MKKFIVYTDGACKNNPGKGAYASLIMNEQLEELTTLAEAYKRTTNNRMELMAIIKALQFLPLSSSITFYTDSQYIVNAVNQAWLKKWQKNNWLNSKKEPVKNRDLWEKILFYINKHKLTFIWVRGHNNNRYNEKADNLASELALNSNNYLIDKEYKEQ